MIDFFKHEEAETDFELFIRVKKELRPEVSTFYHHLREGMKLHAWINEQQLELRAKGFLICRLDYEKYSFANHNMKGTKFRINKIGKQKYLPVKTLEIKVIRGIYLQRK